jgi:hypothetical protein
MTIDQKAVALAAATYGLSVDLLTHMAEMESAKGFQVNKVFNVFANSGNWCEDSLGYINTVVAADFDGALKAFIDIESRHPNSALHAATMDSVDMAKAIDNHNSVDPNYNFDTLAQERELNYYFEGDVGKTFVFKKGRYSDVVVVVTEVLNTRPLFDEDDQIAVYLKHKPSGKFVHGDDGKEFVDTIEQGSYFGAGNPENGTLDDEITVEFILNFNIKECDMKFLEGMPTSDFELVLRHDHGQ